MNYKKIIKTLLFTVFFTHFTLSKMLIQKKTIETKYDIKKGKIFIDLSLSNDIHYETYIDLKHNATILPNDSLSLHSLEELHVVRENAKVLVNKVKTNLILDTNVVPMTIYTLPKFVLSIFSANCLSLLHKYKDESFSFIHQLKDNNFIDKNQFSIIPSSYMNNNNKIVFGELPTNYVSSLYSHSVPVIDNREQWGINLNYVYIKTNYDKYVYTNMNYTYLQSKEKYIRAPEHFMTLFSQYLSSHYDDFHCLYVKGRFNCHCNSIFKIFKSIHFVIEGKDFPISIDNFYECEEYPFNLGPTGYCSLLLSPSDTNEWIIGTTFLEQFITNFDMDNKLVTFYSKTPFKSYTQTKMIISINQCVIMIALMMIIVLIGIKYSLSLSKSHEQNNNAVLLLI